jgi:pimeloyl-ACP methyl ester carboxylesterase
VSEQYAEVSDTRLCYQVLGDEGPVVVLVMGLNLQMHWWRDAFCAGLVQRGMRVVRFDNRDVGRSSTFPPTSVSAWQFMTRKGVRPAYRLEDLADDTAGLIAQVAPEGAHLVGASLGAFVAQETAIRHPRQVLSLTSVMGRPGDSRSGRVAWSMRPRFLSPQAAGEDEQAEQLVRTFRAIGSRSRTAEDDEDVREAVGRSLRRGAQGNANQLAAVLVERDRTRDLQRLSVPTLVVHGTRDRIVRPSGGRATAAAIAGAELLEIPGMGHDLPRSVWPQLLDGIARTVGRAAENGRP